LTDLALSSPRPARRGHNLADALFRALTTFFAAVVLLILGGVIVALVDGAVPALRTFGFSFAVTEVWNPVTEKFGALAPIYGTLVTSLIAMLVGIPVAFGIALFITELCPPWLKRPLGVLIELLAAIPSIIYGIWGLFVFAPFLQEHVQPLIVDTLGELPLVGALFEGPPLGIGILTAGLILGIMVLPFISSIMRDVFETVPSILKESAYGLGATTSEVVWQVVLPYTRVGVVGGIMLGLGRALGETIAVLFIINVVRGDFSWSVFTGGETFASRIARDAGEFDTPEKTGAYIAAGLVLFVLTFAVNAIARVVIERRKAFSE
jgi:phosphate transport system permease protein